MEISWRKIKGKYVITFNGVYKSFTEKELSDLKQVIDDIENGNTKYHKDDNR